MTQYKKATTPGELILDVRLALATRMDRWRAALPGTALLRDFEKVHTWCIFVGYPRSGHSLVGSLIDGHAQATISHRLDGLRFFQEGLDIQRIFYLIHKNSARFAARGRELTGYSYTLPGSWQGRYQNLTVVGDQEADKSVRRLQAHPELIDRLYRLPQLKIKFVHVIRNPFDNIATISKRTFRTLDQAADRYFGLCRAVADLKKRAPAADILDIRHDQVIAVPIPQIQQLFCALDLPAEPAYLRSCCEIIHPTPTLSRHLVKWETDHIQRIQERLAAFPWLAGYHFDQDQETQA